MEPILQNDDNSLGRMRRGENMTRSASNYKVARRHRKRKVKSSIAGMQQRRNKHWAW